MIINAVILTKKIMEKSVSVWNMNMGMVTAMTMAAVAVAVVNMAEG